MNPQVQQYKKAFISASETVEKYARANLIHDFNDGDSTYYHLLLKKMEAYLDYKEAELLSQDREFYFKTVFKPVYSHKISFIEGKVKA